MYLISLGAGVLVGIIYGLINVRSPAPPAIALVGLLGMLIGEQIVPVAKRVIEGAPLTAAWFASECQPKITGVEPAAKTAPNEDDPGAGTRPG
ncbi:XapX domain-containing protein [Massilia niastensis]|uniref:XapX domain-containing protein n=1 Tax=Massilia niastensis TaxID=544911 RepID=UPI00036B2D78|nr:XapX domain-containing protein [Massilia niastensis]